MHQRARTDPSGGRGATRVPTGTEGNADLVLSMHEHSSEGTILDQIANGLVSLG